MKFIFRFRYNIIEDPRVISGSLLAEIHELEHHVEVICAHQILRHDPLPPLEGVLFRSRGPSFDMGAINSSNTILP